MTAETKAFASQCKHSYVKAMTADVSMTRTELFEVPKSCNLFKDCFIPGRYFNQLDTISKVMYRHEIICAGNAV